MHVAEQPAENSACLEEYGCTPFALLDREGMLDERFTAIHGIHLSREEIAAVGRAEVRSSALARRPNATLAMASCRRMS